MYFVLFQFRRARAELSVIIAFDCIVLFCSVPSPCIVSADALSDRLKILNTSKSEAQRFSMLVRRMIRI